MRKDLELIAGLVTPNTRVLDIGCGDGELLDYLARTKQTDSRGIEVHQAGVSKCVKNGLPVVQGDADLDLIHYPDKCFDYAISSQTLQATHNPKTVLDGMLRIAKQVIVSVPNFGHWYNRYHLSCKGRMPVSEALSYEWYETPNIHFCTIKDFIVLCKELDARIEKTIFLGKNNTPLRCPYPLLIPNFFAELGIFVVKGK